MDPQEPKFDSISPFFAVADVDAALEWYCGTLGFELGWKWGEPPTHANVCRGSVDISLSSASRTQGHSDVYVAVSGVDAFHAELRARGVAAEAPSDSDYGMRDFHIVDPWGNRLVFGEPSQGFEQAAR